MGLGTCFSLMIALLGPPAGPNPAPTTRPIQDSGFENEGLVAVWSWNSVEEEAWITTEGRTKKPTRDELAAYHRLHSEETIRRLGDLGVNMIVLPYGGYDPDDREEDARKRTIEFARLCQASDMKVGAIVPVGSMDPDRWTAHESGPPDGLTRTKKGAPIPGAGFRRSYTSRIHAWERQRTKRLVQRAVRDMDPDVLFLPDFLMAVNSETGAEAGYREYIQRRLSQVAVDEATRSYESDSARPTAPDDAESNRDALWKEYRIAALADCLVAARDAAYDEKSDVLIGLAEQGLERQVATRDGAAVDPAALWPLADLLWSDRRVSISSIGRVTHQVVQYKAAPIVVPVPRNKVEAAQSLAFNHGIFGCIAFMANGMVSATASGAAPINPDLVEMARFSRSHRNLYARQETIADVQLCRSRASGVHGGMASAVVSLQTENALVSHHIPFEVVDLVSARTMKTRTARPEHRDPPVLLLSAAERLSDQDMDWLVSRPDAGVGLILIGACGEMDENGHPHKKNLIDRLIARAQSEPESRPDGSRRFACGADKSARVVQLRRPGPMGNAWIMTKKRIRRGSDAAIHEDEFHEALRWALDRPLSVAADFSPSVAVELTSSHSADSIVLHRVNFDKKNPAEPIPVVVQIPSTRVVVSVNQYSPETAEPRRIPFEQAGRSLTFQAGRLDVYDAHLIHTRAQRPPNESGAKPPVRD
ncbi:MAG: hypothetical protein O7B26_10810 [Planctomycetota bacterium]|nr:hypothetical protein [Planctomycetota bacterium]